ncbi:tonsoku-like protein isoform X3 [Agrilus planipennis]|uniref:Tonsoku-like protein isoform X3 n=1 Tax=Agrilus planipennis TaxID=224129 RepID=A0A1W4X0R7_AGRPL|nr:tonsoku-like protein isoform X3 [Agrilus planipennis]
MDEQILLRKKHKAFKVGNQLMFASICTDLGDLYTNEAKYENAIEQYRDLAKTYEELQRRMDYAKANRMIGEAYMHLNQFEEALQCQNIYLGIAQEENNKLEEQRALATIGHTYLTSYLYDSENNKKHLDFAQNFLMKSLVICENLTGISKYDHMDMSARLFANLGVIQECEVAAMCYAEDALLITNDTDYVRRKHLYEKLGDGACELKVYSLGIQYYEKMLNVAIKSGDTDKALSPCYISLAQTYKDNKQYDLSLSYFQKEYSLCRNELKEAVTTLLDMAEVMELAKKDWVQIDSVYRKAYNHCKLDTDNRLKAKVLSRHIAQLKNANKITEAQNLESEYEKLNIGESESESESLEFQTTPNIGDDVCINEITDDSDSSDNEKIPDKLRFSTRKKTKTFMLKKNAKGETQLHTACINGKFELAKKLIQQKHPINIRDNCGWLPIHEACLHGHLDIVELLVNHGATINDRGGTGCGGTTPIHDAAINGHLEIVEFLLNHGASSIVKDDKGDTPLALLKQWRETEKLDTSMQAYYNILIDRMSKDLEKAGQTEKAHFQKSSHSSSVYDNMPSQNNREPEITKSTVVERLRNFLPSNEDLFTNIPSSSMVCNEIFESDSNSNDSISVHENLSSESVTTEYKNVMKNLRRTTWDISKKRKSDEEVKISAHLSIEDIGDDNWLDDDLGSTTNKKRKTILSDNICVFDSFETKRDSFSPKSDISSHSLKELNNLTSKPSQDSNCSPLNNEVSDVTTGTFLEESDSSTDSFKTISEKDQLSPTQTRFLHRNNEKALLTKSNKRNKQKKKYQLKLTDMTIQKYIAEADSTTDLSVSIEKDDIVTQNRNQFLNDPIISVDVRIDSKLYRVPILLSDLNKKTVKWLAEEAARRYARKELVRPVLDLETKNGAVLAEDDFVSILFPAGNIQSEEIQARIVRWDIPSLVERFRESCITYELDVQEEIEETLQMSSTSINLSDFGLRDVYLKPFFKAINHQTNLNDLNLSGNVLTKESMTDLCFSISSLTHLRNLNLSSCNLNADLLKIFSDSFLNNTGQILENLVNLNLNFNPLTANSMKYLATLTRFLKLEALHLAAVDFSFTVFDSSVNKDLELCLKSIKVLDISSNNLKTEEVAKILSWLDQNILENLNVSNNNQFSIGICGEVTAFLMNCENSTLKLKTLNLSRCNVIDDEIEELLRALEFSNGLKHLNLSYNPQLTLKSSKKLLQHYSLVNLNLMGCDIAFTGMKNAVELINFEKCIIRNLSVTFLDDESLKNCEELIKIWKNKYHDMCRIIKQRQFIQFVVFETNQ